MKRLLVIVLTLMLASLAQADRVKVRLFSNVKLGSMSVSFDLGSYNLYADGSQLLEDMAGEGRTVFLKIEGRQLVVNVNQDYYGTFASLRLEATDTACILCINPDGFKPRTYEGDLEVTVGADGKLRLINDVDFETYIAGVVQSEIYGTQTDIFRIQAIISRTWALRNMKKHAVDGYNFCDHVHCQAYLNRCIRPDIMMGAIESSGETLVDADGKLIDTPFHSNSGGQTANSEDVWRAALPYLRSVTDTFSFRMRQSDWTKTMSIDRWLGYFRKSHKIDTDNPDNRRQLLHFEQPQRKAKLLGVPLTKIRTDFQLKSTFFSVSVDSTMMTVTLHGHGYGHGVGLSQEGTIRMVGLGFSYDSILRHYYTGAVLRHDPSAKAAFAPAYVAQLARIIEEDSNQQTRTLSKKDDWLGRLFRLRDREVREEIYIEEEQDNEQDWEYEW